MFPVYSVTYVPGLYRAWLRTVVLPDIPRMQVDLLLELVDALDIRIKRLDQRVRRTVRVSAAAERLQTVPALFR